MAVELILLSFFFEAEAVCLGGSVVVSLSNLLLLSVQIWQLGGRGSGSFGLIDF